MFTFKKFSKNLKRTVSGALCCLILSGLVVPVLAADGTAYSGRLHVQGNVNNGYWHRDFQTPVSGGIQSAPFYAAGTNFTFDNPGFVIFPDTRVAGFVGIYVSFYLYADSPSVAITSPDLVPSDFKFFYSSPDAEGYESPISLDVMNFSAPVVDGRVNSRGYSLKATSYLDDTIVEAPYLGLYCTTYKQFSLTSSSSFTPYFCVPTVNFILSSSLSDLGALESVADSIVSQSQVMTAYYGDIMSILNDMYLKMGSIEAAANLANSYFSQLIPLVNSLSTNTANIYSLLQTQFQLLRTLIATESDDIQAAIEQQTDDLIAYFDTVFSDAVGDMPEKTDDLNQSVGDVSDAESNYQSTATQRFDQLTDTFSGGFSGGTLAGVTLAATLFTRVWNALGDYVIVYTWPLFLGLCLVILGRMSRLSGGQSSSEKHRGDSDA